jgi:hypothetical protein
MKQLGRPRKRSNGETYAERFGSHIALLRESKGLSIPEMLQRLNAEGLPLTRHTLYRIERGASCLKFNDLPKLVNALGLESVRELLPER